ncbi:MAG: hypothetical protein OXH36_00570 [Bdellovibrionales bacterium]|nr:hypothetical protein [Bdellovibrionales bacterium]
MIKECINNLKAWLPYRKESNNYETDCLRGNEDNTPMDIKCV